jgi:DNA invertase Pin-like site-specific DNA recombinase
MPQGRLHQSCWFRLRRLRGLLKDLGTLRDHGVSLYVHSAGIDTSMGSAFAVLDIIDAFRRAKLSRAIRLGQARCVAAGKVIGRPAIGLSVRTQIQAYLAEGAGLRSTARRFRVSPASVVNIRRASVRGPRSEGGPATPTGGAAIRLIRQRNSAPHQSVQRPG